MSLRVLCLHIYQHQTFNPNFGEWWRGEEERRELRGGEGKEGDPGTYYCPSRSLRKNEEIRHRLIKFITYISDKVRQNINRIILKPGPRHEFCGALRNRLTCSDLQLHGAGVKHDDLG